MWLQCEECLKWRSILSNHYDDIPEIWHCSQNPNRRYRCVSGLRAMTLSVPIVHTKQRLWNNMLERHRRITDFSKMPAEDVIKCKQGKKCLQGRYMNLCLSNC